MAFCASCGSPVEGKFCAKCGATVGAAAPPPPQQPAGGYQPPVQPIGGNYPPPNPGPATGMADNAASALCYVLGLITGILFLVLEPYNKNRTVRFHAFQSIFLNIAMIVVAIALGIFDALIAHMIGWWFASMVSMLFNLALFAVWIYMILMTYQGRTIVLPVIGPLAQQQAG
jgi:uncharacterized membrane protein